VKFSVRHKSFREEKAVYRDDDFETRTRPLTTIPAYVTKPPARQLQIVISSERIEDKKEQEIYYINRTNEDQIAIEIFIFIMN